MITCTLEKKSGKPLYELLYEKIRADIIEGRLKAGERLPSKRALSAQCGVSVITVENAYAQLEAEGFVRAKPRSGFYVSEVFPAGHPASSSPPLVRNGSRQQETGVSGQLETCSADGHKETGVGGQRQAGAVDISQVSGAAGRQPAGSADGQQAGPAGMPRETDPDTALYGTWSRLLQSDSRQEQGAEEPLFADFTSNAIPPTSFPFSVWSRLMRQTLSEDQELLLERSPSEGIYVLRAAIADYLRQFRGFEADPEQIVIGAGTEYLYGLLLQLFGQGTVVAVEEPGYQKVSRVCASYGASVRHIPVDAQGMDPRRLYQSDASVIHISPGHHFPTGVVMPIGRRMALLEWAAEREGRYIIEDDYDSEFRMTGRPVPTLAGIDRGGRVIYMNTFSKSLSQTIRISYMILPYPLLERYRRQLDFYACTVSNFEQYTLAKFISGGYFEKHINRMRNYYRGVRDGLLDEIVRCGGRDQVREEHAGLHFLLTARAQGTDAQLVRRCRERGIAVSCLSSSYADPASSPPHVLVMNYTSLQREKTREAVRRLYEAIEGKD